MIITKYSEFESLSDEELVRTARESKGNALTALIIRYTPVIRKIAAGYSSVFTDIDDRSQNGMMALLRAVDTYSEDKSVSFASYAGVCITNAVISAVRQSSNSTNSFLNNSIPIDDIDIPTDDTPEARFIRNEQYIELLNDINSVLSDTERKVLSLYLHGCSYREISAKAGISEKQADNALQRAKKKIRAL